MKHTALFLALACMVVACGGGTPANTVDAGADRSSLADAADALAGDASADVPPADTGMDAAPMDTTGDVLESDALTDVSTTDVGVDTSSMDVPAMDSVPDVLPEDVVVDGPAVIPPRPVTLPTNGSAVAITPDNAVAVAVNRTENSVTVFNTGFGSTPPTLSRTAELPTGSSTEPWSVVIGNDGDTAYVIYRQSQQVAKIAHLHTSPNFSGAPVPTGSEPTGIAISPSGTQLYVANWAEGTVSVINATTMTLSATVDLNGPLAATGLLGTVGGRPALAHPRAIVVTNDGTGTDGGQTVYVTEFFSQARTTGVPTDDSRFDVGRQGVVYPFNAGSYTVGTPITIAPVNDTGFADSDGVETGCFPNQLYAAALNGGRLYVTSVCVSPRGPVNVLTTASGVNTANVRTQVHASVFVIDTTANAEIPSLGIRLPQQFNTVFGAVGGRIPLIPIDLAFTPASHTAYIAAYGSDAAYRIAYNADGTLQQVGSSTQPLIDLQSAVPNVGQLPYGIAIDNTGMWALVANETTRNVSVVQLSTQSVVAAYASTGPVAVGYATSLSNGRQFFVTGTGRWSLNGSTWNSCESCHPDGLSDGVTWYFARGPRQTISLDGTFDALGDQRMLNWSAMLDEVHDFENNTRANSGGVGAVVDMNSTPPALGDRIIFDGTTPVVPQVATLNRQDGLNGALRAMMPENAGVAAATGGTALNSLLSNWDDVENWIKQLRSPRAPATLSAADVSAGQALFVTNNCAGCHGGPLWTVSQLFYTPGEANNNLLTGSLITDSWTRPVGFPSTVAAASSTFRPSPFDPNNDQITCVLRNVGTFPSPSGPVDAMGRQLGVAPTGVNFLEVRADTNGTLPSMTVPAQGATGFNPPALIGLGPSAPYFHGGNARTLEELFSATFAQHHQAYAPGFLASGDAATAIRQMVAFLLSIDDSAATVPVPTAAALTFNPNICATVSFP